MKHRCLLLLCLGALLVSVAACGTGSEESKTSGTTQTSETEAGKKTVEKLESSLYVKKVENLSDDFIMGVDLSSVLAEEASGVKYYNFAGEEQDIFKTLAECGVNTIRVRVWNDPYDAEGHGFGGGNNDIDAAVAIGKRAAAAGLSLLVDFHYSDFWADPGKQMIPRAWKGLKYTEKVDALYQFTKESLEKLKAAGVPVSMVQVGNETNGAMAGYEVWEDIAELMKAGSKAIREVYPEALVAVHFANPEKAGSYQTYASNLNFYGVDYDVFGSSYYPYWHGTLDNLAKTLNEISEKYGKKVMVLETSYAFTGEDTDFSGNTIGDGSAVTKDYPYTVQGQANAVRNVIDTVASLPQGIGVVYWEGAWITVGTNSWEENSAKWEKYGSGWASSYAAVYDPDDAGKYYGGSAVDNQAFFDAAGKPLESLKIFNLVRFGNEVEVRADALEDVTLQFDLNGSIDMPETVSAVMNDDSRQTVPVSWNLTEEDIQKMKSNGPEKYVITGDASGMKATAYVSMIEYNFLKNDSFEDGTVEPWVVNDLAGADQLYVENKGTDSLTGKWHMHFWSEKKNSVEFTLEQSVKNLESGNYKYAISIMGGDAGETEIYAYVKINGEIIAQVPLEITFYGSWDTAQIPSFAYEAGQELSVGIYVKCSGAGNGAWGKIDDAMLNKASE